MPVHRLVQAADSVSVSDIIPKNLDYPFSLLSLVISDPLIE